MIRAAAISLIACALILAVWAGAHAQAVCATRAEMTEGLKRKFGEAQTGLGLVSAGQVLEVWSSPATGTWSILMTDATGRTCLVALGQSWRSVPVAEPKGEPL